jgi:hypothetical protein
MFLILGAGVAGPASAATTGTVIAWGYNGFEQATVPDGPTDVTAVAAGSYHSLALHTDGSVTAWGDNRWGQLNIPDGLTDVTAIAAGYFHSLALHRDGTVTAWGNSVQGQASVPDGLTDVTAIAAGYFHSLALSHSADRPLTIDGFFGPVHDDTLGTAKAGSTIPLQFRVYDGDTELTDPTVIAGFTAQRVSCPEAASSGEEVDFTTTGGTALRYTDGKFQQNWKTPKTPGCYQVTLTTTDNTSKTATFLLR